MRQVKRLFYMVLLNVIISAITIIVVIQVWQRNHPPVAEDTPAVIVITSISADTSPISNPNAIDTESPTDTGIQVIGTVQATPTVKMLVYQVKEGDSLGALAIQFNLSLEDLLIANDLSDPDSIYVGQLIYIPTAPLPKTTPTNIPTTAVATHTLRPSQTPTYGPTNTITPTPIGMEPQVVIATVIGVGDLNIEHVVLERTGLGDLSLSGWRLEDGAGKEYTFPQLTLYKGGTINLYTRTGQDSVVDLFWGLSSSIWRTGKTVSLYDAQNNLRATYTVP